ncbi:hypothetical protein B1H18_34585 [Streptomyces tsukubensis]|uniref:Uncharacterized protein n=2 Tax=Streptomyces tsukubensis TaxID=83656 RepID=A0A1V3ZYM9_9ACTN|nr:hypothetical protein B1H18_34585 [Streptomyces tsukubensis]
MALAAAGVAATLCAGFPLSAQAATGSFTYTVYGHQRIINGPADGRCYTVGNASGDVSNNTDQDALLYTGRNCTGDIARSVSAGDTDEDVAFESVVFGS